MVVDLSYIFDQLLDLFFKENLSRDNKSLFSFLSFVEKIYVSLDE